MFIEEMWLKLYIVFQTYNTAGWNSAPPAAHPPPAPAWKRLRASIVLWLVRTPVHQPYMHSPCTVTWEIKSNGNLILHTYEKHNMHAMLNKCWNVTKTKCSTQRLMKTPQCWFSFYRHIAAKYTKYTTQDSQSLVKHKPTNLHTAPRGNV